MKLLEQADNNILHLAITDSLDSEKQSIRSGTTIEQISAYLMYQGDVLSDRDVFNARPRGEPIEVLRSMHTDTQGNTNIFVHGASPAQEGTRGSCTLLTREVGAAKVVQQLRCAFRDMLAERRDRSECPWAFLSDAEVHNGRRTGRGDGGHALCCVHGARVVKRVHHGLRYEREQFVELRF